MASISNSDLKRLQRSRGFNEARRQTGEVIVETMELYKELGLLDGGDSQSFMNFVLEKIGKLADKNSSFQLALLYAVYETSDFLHMVDTVYSKST